MNIKNKPSVFVPPDHVPEFEKLSKAALMDMVWDYANQFSGGDGEPTRIMNEFRLRREIILSYRDGALS